MKKLLSLLGIILFTSQLYAQVPTNQDCLGAIPVCQNVYNEANSYSGTGNYPTEVTPLNSCLGGAGEVNSVWYIFTVQTAGNVCFTITPNVSGDDYDWAVYDITNNPCSDIGTNAALEVSCNFSGVSGPTGPNGGAGAQEEQCIPVNVGDTYAVLVNNWSGSTNGYSIDFGASSATIFDNVAPTTNTVTAPACGSTQFTFDFSEFILCNSIAACDFTLTGPGGPYTVTGITSAGCAAGGTQDISYTATVSPAINTTGAFSLCLTNACGGVQDLCGNVQTNGCWNFNMNCTNPCFLNFISVTVNPCDPVTDNYWIDGQVQFTDPPATGVLTITNLCTGQDTVINPPFVSPLNWSISNIPSGNAPDCDVVAVFSADPTCTISLTSAGGQPYPVPASCLCPADAGTTNQSITGLGQNNYVLCDGDAININSNNDHTHPNDVGVINGTPYNPLIGYLIYTCPPTTNDPATDPCYSGYTIGQGPNMVDPNVGGSAGGLLGFLLGVGTPTPIVNNTLYYVPFTFYDGATWTYNTGCFDLGAPVPVTYLEPITYNAVENCATQSWDVTITGGYANMFGGNFTLSNLTPANASFSTTTVADGGTVTINGLTFGDTFTFTVTDANGCTIQVTGGPYTCCPADAGTVTANMTGQGINDFILCDGDVININSNGDFVNSPGADPGILYAIYFCPPTPGLDPALDPCYAGYVIGTPPDFTDTNIGGSGGGLLGTLIGLGVPVVGNTLWYAPFTMTDIAGGPFYDPTCFNVGPATQVTYLEPITFNAVENCPTQSWDVTITGGYANMFGGNFTLSNLTPANASFSTTTIADGGTVSINGLVFGDTFSFTVTDANGCTIQVTGGPYSCCPADAGTTTATMTGNSLNNYILCFGDQISITSNNDYVNSPGANPDILYAIYICPPTPGMDPAIDPCYSGYVTGTPPDFFDTNNGASIYDALVGLGVPVVNQTLWFAPMTHTDVVGGPFYDPTCFDIGLPTQVTYLNDIVAVGVEDCQTGTVTVTITGGYPELFPGNNYNLSNLLPATAALSSNTVTTHGGTVDITGLQDGDMYSFDIVDDNGCPISFTGGPFVGLDDATITPAGPYCPLDLPVQMTAVDPGGTWTATCGACITAGGMFDPAIAGTGNHTITYTIPGQCGNTDTEVIAVQASLNATINPAGPFCESNASAILAAVDPGGSWSATCGACVDAISGSFDPAVAGPGTHTITYDIPGPCGDQQTTTIDVIADDDATITPAGPYCTSDPVATMAAVDAGGTWTSTCGACINAATGDFDPSIAGAGNHDITYTIAGACGDQDIITVLVSDQLDATITPAGPYCESDPIVTMTAVDPGGTWSATCGACITATGDFDPSIAGAGNHDITYTIPSSCGDQQTATIVVNPDLDATITPVGPYCVGDVPVNLVGADPGGTWTGTGITDAVNGTFDPASAGVGNHTVTYDIPNPCGDQQTLVIVVTANDDPTISAAGPFCQSAAAVFLSAVDPGGTWSGNGITDPNNGTFDPVAAGPGTHTITYTIPGTCGATDTEDIIVNADPVIDFVVDNASGCVPITVTFTDNSIPAGTTCLWDFGDGSTSTLCGTVSHTYNQTGCFDVTLTITTADGCTNTLTNTSMVCAFDIPVANFQFGPQPTTILNSTINFTNTSTGATAYFWDFGGLGTSTQTHPSFTFPSDAPGSYDVCLIAMNADGCADTICQTIIINDEFIIYVPNAFTPDGDEFNNIFTPVINGADPLDYNLYVFNRWGELIFESHFPTIGWDGTYKGTMSQQDVYVWKIVLKDATTGEKKEFYGHVTLLK
jgi:gliding motility-associated-like protein